MTSEGGDGPPPPDTPTSSGQFDDVWNEQSDGPRNDRPAPEVTPPPSSGQFENAWNDEQQQQRDGVMVMESAEAMVPRVSWLRQFRCVLKKNMQLLSRRPLTMFLMIFSSVCAALLAWPAGRDTNEELFPPIANLTECGTIPQSYLDSMSIEEQNKVPISLNEEWRRGLPVAILSLGPMFQAICAFIVVHEELQLDMFSVLKALGLRDSVYWMSWYAAFAISSLLNSLLGAIAAKTLPVHVFESTYFGGIFASLFFCQLALIAASLFLAALCGRAKKPTIWLVLVMLIAVWIPILILNVQSTISETSFYQSYSSRQTPVGLFWINYQTQLEQRNSNTFQYETCNIPIMSEAEGTVFKTEEQREEVSDDEFFLGCYAAADFGARAWNPEKQKFGLAVLWFFPYFHFNTIWGNFLGYTGFPGNEFTGKQLSMTTKELYVEALPAPLNPENSFGTTLFPQGSMLQMKVPFPEECIEFDDNGSCSSFGNNCPNQNRTGYNFCDIIEYDQCYYSPEPAPAQTKSAGQMLGYLVALSIGYSLMAAYWGVVFMSGGTHKFYFFLQPSYWFGTKGGSKQSAMGSENGTRHEESAGIVVDNVRKLYGSDEALKGVTLQMTRGEVTALLGHNGAGKTTLSKVMTCEVPASSGDITVFGHSVSEDPYAVRRLVGICKQDDYLWPDLTAKEHLDLFAGLRGVEPSRQLETVEKWLESVDLDTVQLQQTRSFSGGMKRRLSVALSTIGGRPLIVLDEPTTGMDPVSRRFVWKHIDEIKKGRVVLLTTHAMEEADLLADMVAIVRKGELAAFGSPLQLKSDHGSALQFSLLVEKANLTAAVEAIVSRFHSETEWVTIEAGEAGNINVNIQKIQQNRNEEGVGVGKLSDFVAWLESDASPVQEYGFSNSSLEEVFLKVTGEGREELDFQGQERIDCVDSRIADEAAGRDLLSYEPNLNTRTQARALVWHGFIRNWRGRGSLWNWILYSLLLVASTLVGVTLAGAADHYPPLTVPVLFLSLLLLSISSSIYGDRAEDLFYLKRTQGLLASSYMVGTSFYAFFVQLIYGFLLLSFFYAMPGFRDPELCTSVAGTCTHSFGDRPIAYPQEIENFDTGGNGKLRAYASPGGYAKMIIIAVFFALTAPGAALASAYLPGYKFALVAIAFFTLLASIAPLIVYFTQPHIDDEEDLQECFSNIVSPESCIELYTTDNLNADFLNCVGAQINSLQGLCIPAYTALLPQFGVFQTLAMVLSAEITFDTVPPSSYVEDVLIPSIDSDCSGDSCKFPYASTLYWANIGFLFVSAVLLLILGVLLSYVFAFPAGWVLHMKHRLDLIWAKVLCRGESADLTGGTGVEQVELEEVRDEREIVQGLVRPLLDHPELELSAVDHSELSGIEEPHPVTHIEQNPTVADHSMIPREDLPPILAHRLRKVYPSIGGIPPKVALKSLDLHVPKGQVLGLLGKNGAGKTTVLKILAGAHDATSGLALVAGYDVSCERISVFERLGNCPQFDVIWPKLSVRQHLVFFAKLKGLRRDQVEVAALDIASAVGLGTSEVYNRNAGDLSGGMRRRLSIAISLIGAPSVFVLDEPTTGLDPSTRNSIWGLVNSFATEDRAIIITTHMMIEADTLCNRIAIVARGELVVVGTQQHLKDRFGSGYLLQLNLVKSTPENQETAMAFVHEHLHKDATLGIKQAKTLHISLPRELDLQRVFAALYNPDLRPSCINQFLLSQSSLEDVFLALGD